MKQTKEYDIELLLQECYMRELTQEEREWLYDQAEYLSEYLDYSVEEVKKFDDYLLIKQVYHGMHGYAFGQF